jgi:DNA-binding MarR family transcriptional regulator
MGTTPAEDGAQDGGSLQRPRDLDQARHVVDQLAVCDGRHGEGDKGLVIDEGEGAVVEAQRVAGVHGGVLLPLTRGAGFAVPGPRCVLGTLKCRHSDSQLIKSSVVLMSGGLHPGNGPTMKKQPDKTAAPRPTDQFLGMLLMDCALRLRERTARALAPLGLSPREFGLLNQVSCSAGMTQAQLGEKLGIDRTTLVNLIDALQAKALVVREADENDRRVYRIGMSTTGHTCHQTALSLVVAAEDDFVRGLDREDRDTLGDALRRLRAHEAGRAD